MDDANMPTSPEPATPATNPSPIIEMKMLICAPGVMLSANVGITQVNIKDLMAIEGDRLHKDLVAAANTGIEIMARQYNGQAAPVLTGIAAGEKQEQKAA